MLIFVETKLPNIETIIVTDMSPITTKANHTFTNYNSKLLSYSFLTIFYTWNSYGSMLLKRNSSTHRTQTHRTMNTDMPIKFGVRFNGLFVHHFWLADPYDTRLTISIHRCRLFLGFLTIATHLQCDFRRILTSRLHLLQSFGINQCAHSSATEHLLFTFTLLTIFGQQSDFFYLFGLFTIVRIHSVEVSNAVHIFHYFILMHRAFCAVFRSLVQIAQWMCVLFCFSVDFFLGLWHLQRK